MVSRRRPSSARPSMHRSMRPRSCRSIRSMRRPATSRSSCSTRRQACRSCPASTTPYGSRRPPAAAAASLEIVPLKPSAPRTRYGFILTNRIRSTAGVAAGADARLCGGPQCPPRGPNERPGGPAADAAVPAIAPLVTTATTFSVYRATPSSSRGACSRSRSAKCWTSSRRPRPRARRARLRRHHHRAARRGPAGPREHLCGLHPNTVFRRSRESADELLGERQSRAADRREPDSDRACAAPTHPVARDPAERDQRPNATRRGLAGRDLPTRDHAESHGDVRDRGRVRASGFCGHRDRFAAARHHGHGEPFYQGAESPFGNNERHFNLDNVGATGIFAPDGQIDNGWQILNLGNPLNARDHFRQAVSDTIALTRTLPA